MNHIFTSSTMLGVLLFSSLFISSSADATTYFSGLANDEKEEYTKWVDAHSSYYPRHTFMPSAGDPSDGAAFFWNINDDAVNFALAVRTEGWVGFGLSEAGGMIGSDMALITVAEANTLVDSHVVEDKTYPVTDDCQDWVLEGTTIEDGWMIIEMSRLLDTGDSQDHAIKYDVDLWSPPTRIIAAWGDSEYVSYHAGKKARNSVRLHADHSNRMTEMETLLNTLEEESDGHFDFLEDNFRIPAVETTYQDLCRTFDELGIDLPTGRDMLTVIGAVPVIDEHTAQHIHHFTVYVGKECNEENQLTRTMIYAWAPGDEGWALPKNVGFPVFDGMNNQAVHMQIHYDNPTLKQGMRDSSGLKFYYTHDEREHRAGILEVGDPWLSLGGEEIAAGHTKYEFNCPGSCSAAALLQKERSVEDQGVTIISEFLHMHQTGVRMTNEVLRDGQVYHKASAEVFDFEQQGVHHVAQESYKVMPGDSFRTACYYKDGTTFGLASQEEMCIAYIMYYPAKALSQGAMDLLASTLERAWGHLCPRVCTLQVGFS
mmetsp:Transcript_2003/g.4945  ORF Transcript_2003/g.4945 Transcript_2003/m.4945 type:complete len:542 (+) Transcript_2003:262-1887(+)